MIVKKPWYRKKKPKCPICKADHKIFGPKDIITVGFGEALLIQDGKIRWQESDLINPNSWDDYLNGERAEQIAAQFPDAIWEIHLIGPLSEKYYRREGPHHWVLFKTGPGFA